MDVQRRRQHKHGRCDGQRHPVHGPAEMRKLLDDHVGNQCGDAARRPRKTSSTIRLARIASLLIEIHNMIEFK